MSSGSERQRMVNPRKSYPIDGQYAINLSVLKGQKLHDVRFSIFLADLAEIRFHFRRQQEARRLPLKLSPSPHNRSTLYFTSKSEIMKRGILTECCLY
jgi:hypothetical protein